MLPLWGMKGLLVRAQRILRCVVVFALRVVYVGGAACVLMLLLHGPVREALPPSVYHYVSDLWDDSVQLAEDSLELGVSRAWELYWLARRLHDYSLPFESRMEAGQRMMQMRQTRDGDFFSDMTK